MLGQLPKETGQIHWDGRLVPVPASLFVPPRCIYIAQGPPRRFDESLDGFLLQEDADRLIAEAEASDVGMPEACAPAPALLPVSGRSASSGPWAWALLLGGLVLVGAGLGLRRRMATLL